MRRYGVHTSIAGGIYLSMERAHGLGCTTAQIFSHNPRGWRLGEITEGAGRLFREYRDKFDISPVFVHCSYLINLVSESAEIIEKSVIMLSEEMRRADAIGADYVILHLHGEGPYAIERMAEGIKKALKNRPKSMLLIENTARTKIPEMGEILKMSGGLVAGVCIDTCHAFAAGYELRNSQGLKALCGEINKYIGEKMVKAVHFNDSKGECGSGIDRHEHIGKGKIGAEAMKGFLEHRCFKDVPIILETPRKTPGDDPMNLKAVRGML